jgi:hypothetical protein
MRDFEADKYQQALERVCKCGEKYTVQQYLESSLYYFSRPFNYRAGCETYCLACWLGVGPNDFPSEVEEDPEGTGVTSVSPNEIILGNNSNVEHEEDRWNYEEVYASLMEGDVLPSFRFFLSRGAKLVIMPIARLHVDRTVVFPGAITFYPPGVADLESLNIIQNRRNTTSLAEHSSAASGIDRDILEHHPLVVFPCQFDWETFLSSSHRSHLEFIRRLSEYIDNACLNFVRYKSCCLGLMDDLPAHAGQVASNHMMAAALLYSNELSEARIIGGAAFTHYLTRGLGLPLDQLEWNNFPQVGETGKIVNHAISLYTSILESDNPTARFMQALGLLEFLADPFDYQQFKKVSKIIARYVARDLAEFHKIRDRFYELTGKKDSSTGFFIGYRTRVVHMGTRIEELVPDPGSRKNLFLELDGYIRPVIDHMVAHSEKSFADYLKVREDLCCF